MNRTTFRGDIYMKYMRNLLLILCILCILAFWSAAADAARIWVNAQDQNDNYLTRYDHIGQTYNGQSCLADATWVVYGYNSYGSDWRGCPTCWAIEVPPDALDKNGKLNFPKSVCGERYSFKNIYSADGYFGSYVGQTFVDSAWVTNYVESPTNVVIPWWLPAVSNVWARYDRNARVVKNIYLYNSTTGNYDLESTTPTWYKVNDLKYYVVPNQEAQNRFLTSVRHFGSAWEQPLAEIVANGGPYGYVHD